MGKKKKVLMYPITCNKCGKPAVENKEESNENWKVLDAKCECGGVMRMDFTRPYYE